MKEGGNDEERMDVEVNSECSQGIYGGSTERICDAMRHNACELFMGVLRSTIRVLTSVVGAVLQIMSAHIPVGRGIQHGNLCLQ